jgi:MFS transporter, YNFM family, putative membrane transport protein
VNQGEEPLIAPRYPTPYIERGTPAFRRTNLALFSAGFSTFALLYCVQPLLPVFSREFGVSAAESSLSLSLTTALLAASVLIAGSLSEAWGRKSVMVVSLFAAAILTVICALVPGWRALLLIRALEGIAFSGLPAVAMAYLSEEMDYKSVGLAMGLYIGGSGLGGMTGRFVTGYLTDIASWRVALGAVGGFGILAALIFWRTLSPSRHFEARPLALRELKESFLDHLRDAGLPWLFIEGFLLMGSFVTTYNYIGYRLLAAPYSLSQTEVGAIFAVYLFGTGSSAWVGNLAGRLGRRKVFWATIAIMLTGLLLTLLSPLIIIITGVAVLTVGYFGAHSIASSWVGLRARHSKAQASALYLFFYYVGSSVAGSTGGLFWSASGWKGVVGFTGSLVILALLISLRLSVLQPLPVLTEQPPQWQRCP